MSKRHTKKLLVEGNEDLAAIAYLMDAHLPGGWGNDRDEYPLIIRQCDGIENLLAVSYIGTQLKSSESRHLGIVVDANDSFESRWASIKRECLTAFPDLPELLPVDGLVISNPTGNRLGVWIMPDNRSRGMLETLLGFIVQNPQNALWTHTVATADQARQHGASFRDVHRDKAQIHTWLAWQDPPGRTLGSALRDRCLDPNSPVCAAFIGWFKRLFELP